MISLRKRITSFFQSRVLVLTNNKAEAKVFKSRDDAVRAANQIIRDSEWGPMIGATTYTTNYDFGADEHRVMLLAGRASLGYIGCHR